MLSLLTPVALARGRFIDPDIVFFLLFALGVAALTLWAMARYRSFGACLVAGGALWAALWAGEQDYVVAASGVFVAVCGVFAYLEGIKNEILDAVAETARRGKGPEDQPPASSPEAASPDREGE